MAFEWTDMAYQQQTSGGAGGLAFVLGVVFVFIFLAALYESLTLPLAVILIVPMCLLAAIAGREPAAAATTTSSRRSAWWC